MKLVTYIANTDKVQIADKGEVDFALLAQLMVELQGVEALRTQVQLARKVALSDAWYMLMDIVDGFDGSDDPDVDSIVREWRTAMGVSW